MAALAKPFEAKIDRPLNDATVVVLGACHIEDCLILDEKRRRTDPAEKGKKRKDKWLFTQRDEPIFCTAGIWRETKDVGEAFTMLTMEPGPDIAPYHDRQIVILERGASADWLDPSVPAQSLIRPLPAGSLLVEQVG